MDRFRFQLLSSIAFLLLPTTLFAVNHLILIDELFSSPDGAVQFLELRAEANFQTQLMSTHIVATNHDGTEQSIIYDFVEVFPELDEG